MTKTTTVWIAKCVRCGLIERYSRVTVAPKCPKCGFIMSVTTERHKG